MFSLTCVLSVLFDTVNQGVLVRTAAITHRAGNPKDDIPFFVHVYDMINQTDMHNSGGGCAA